MGNLTVSFFFRDCLCFEGDCLFRIQCFLLFKYRSRLTDSIKTFLFSTNAMFVLTCNFFTNKVGYLVIKALTPNSFLSWLILAVSLALDIIWLVMLLSLEIFCLYITIMRIIRLASIVTLDIRVYNNISTWQVDFKVLL